MAIIGTTLVIYGSYFLISKDIEIRKESIQIGSLNAKVESKISSLKKTTLELQKELEHGKLFESSKEFDSLDRLVTSLEERERGTVDTATIHKLQTNLSELRTRYIRKADGFLVKLEQLEEDQRLAQDLHDSAFERNEALRAEMPEIQYYFILSAIFLCLGIYLMVNGFRLWYHRLQKYVDLQIASQFASSDASTKIDTNSIDKSSGADRT